MNSAPRCLSALARIGRIPIIAALMAMSLQTTSATSYAHAEGTGDTALHVCNGVSDQSRLVGTCLTVVLEKDGKDDHYFVSRKPRSVSHWWAATAPDWLGGGRQRDSNYCGTKARIEVSDSGGNIVIVPGPEGIAQRFEAAHSGPTGCKISNVGMMLKVPGLRQKLKPGYVVCGHWYENFKEMGPPPCVTIN